MSNQQSTTESTSCNGFFVKDPHNPGQVICLSCKKVYRIDESKPSEAKQPPIFLILVSSAIVFILLFSIFDTASERSNDNSQRQLLPQTTTEK